MSFETDLLLGVAQLLDADGCGTYAAAGESFSAGQTGISIGVDLESVDRQIVLTSYPVSDDIGPTADDVIGVQVKTRAAGLLDLRDLDELVFASLQGRRMFTLPTGVLVTDCWRQSSAELGRDSSRRWARSSNYYLTACRPTAHR